MFEHASSSGRAQGVTQPGAPQACEKGKTGANGAFFLLVWPAVLLWGSARRGSGDRRCSDPANCAACPGHRMFQWWPWVCTQSLGHQTRDSLLLVPGSCPGWGRGHGHPLASQRTQGARVSSPSSFLCLVPSRGDGSCANHSGEGGAEGASCPFAWVISPPDPHCWGLGKWVQHGEGASYCEVAQVRAMERPRAHGGAGGERAWRICAPARLQIPEPGLRQVTGLRYLFWPPFAWQRLHNATPARRLSRAPGEPSSVRGFSSLLRSPGFKVCRIYLHPS